MARVSGTFLNRHLLLGGAIVAWLLFAASFLMPVTSGWGRMVRWEAFWMYVSAQLNVPKFWQEVQQHPLESLTCTFSWTNFTMVLAPVVLWCWPRWSAWLGFLLVLGGLVPCILFNEAIRNGELRIGFYCWVVSIFLMAGVCLWNWLWYRRRAAHL